ncbi:uncharacterized protein BT62DRAFT_1006250 [Guyanagaster necrorhizus]|uniref:Uncharacterized protein n=1 Tax=Guyanagaster necrorhizus TaxID=856835 RepID=A0A9P7VU14_9AGAR|nr:uncharacterized protein BT62DRAFT_1006250 [Guyanagaster necrorhizus MCA 3950]KAG7446069.1 hypothetical protein BT62DRAFT_1006250 [Guyanagaster necrorhizus MCA 3950]
MNKMLSSILSLFATTVNWAVMVVISASSIVSESRLGLHKALKEMLVAMLKFDVWMMRISEITSGPDVRASGYGICSSAILKVSQADMLNSLVILESFIITPSTRVRDLIEVIEVLQAYKERLSHLQSS